MADRITGHNSSNNKLAVQGSAKTFVVNCNWILLNYILSKSRNGAGRETLGNQKTINLKLQAFSLF
jgi:hypothetical protein